MHNMSLGELNDIMRRCEESEYTFFLSYFPTHEVRITLEKGSTYGKVHMKVEGRGRTASEAFENALRNFPSNPVGSHWDTHRIAGPITEGQFTEVGSPTSNLQEE